MSDLLFEKTWKMSPDKSNFSTSFTPTDETRIYEPVGDGYKLTVAGICDGERYSWNYTAQYDGQPHPVYGRDDVDSITIYRINDRVTVGFFKKNLMPGGPYARFVSEDGQALTVEAAGHRPDGSPFYDVIQYHM